MKLLKNKRFLLLLLFLINATGINAIAWYWFCGWMNIQGDSLLNYYLYAWDNTQKKMVLNPSPLPTNKVFLLQDLLGGVDNCPAMWWGQVGTDQSGNPIMGGTTFLLVPKVPYISVANTTPQDVQAFEDKLLTAIEYPYIYVERAAPNLIQIYIIGPRPINNLGAQKLTFNMPAFESIWGHDPNQYKSWQNQPITIGPAISGNLWNGYDMGFAFSFNTITGTFLNSDPLQHKLSNDAFYISGILNKKDKMSWSWNNQQTPPNAVVCCIGLTMDKLISQGIVTYSGPIIEETDLQRVINWINGTGQAKLANVI